MLTFTTPPGQLRLAVERAVRDGAWAPADVVATVASDSEADRRQIIAMLWDLVAEGVLTHSRSAEGGWFRPTGAVH